MYEALLIIHFLALAAGIGLSITLAVQSAHARRLPPEDADRFMAQAAKAAVIAPIAVLLTILSGVGLAWQQGWAPLDFGLGFWLKMAAVALLLICVAGAKIQGDKARANPSGPGIARAEACGKGALVTSVLAVIAAVLTFG
ncbi:MAG: hypothetical protein HOM52_12485 [Rhodospirillaceae bacterium]|jgi:hypothetical protein|nr:hypothetical protein [Rhodospirillaceae bacterium]MBT4428448.1 hypothetical protein [Rhodospirillaceae bacterium]MBT5039322.1 hypothetical protein [Rhodospirillaceae bacterium]MBT5674504.1 hypothetical protein [Rhodospirillaceae bacterium]MBT5779862.1 hypothetical protein [Rhodospirillaceae bacterium]